MKHAIGIATLLGCLVLAVSSLATARADDKEIKSKTAKEAFSERDAALKKADDELATKVKDARATLAKKLDDAIKLVMGKGDLDEANRISELKKQLAADLEPKDLEKLTTAAAKDAKKEFEAAVAKAREAHAKKVSDATKSFSKKLDVALKEAMKKGDLDEAKKIDEAKKAAEDEVGAKDLKGPDGWTVLFRSSDPALWNTDANKGESSFALPCARAPRSMKWLRLRRMDTKAEVIFAVTKDQLTQRATDGDLAWEGSGQFAQGGRHLGIDKKAWHRTVQDGGKIMVTHDRGNGGWGFGHKVHVNDKQYFCWAGDEIDETVFEIAVKPDVLTKAEAELVLK